MQAHLISLRKCQVPTIYIEPYTANDFETLWSFVAAIQEHERLHVPELKEGAEIGRPYAQLLLDNVAEKQGLILVARDGSVPVALICAWISDDDDTLLRDYARRHAFVSDLFVADSHRRQGLAGKMLRAMEQEMSRRGCRRIRICSKATNEQAWKCYGANGYQPYEILFSKTLD